MHPSKCDQCILAVFGDDFHQWRSICLGVEPSITSIYTVMHGRPFSMGDLIETIQMRIEIGVLLPTYNDMMMDGVEE